MKAAKLRARLALYGLEPEPVIELTEIPRVGDRVLVPEQAWSRWCDGSTELDHAVRHLFGEHGAALQVVRVVWLIGLDDNPSEHALLVCQLDQVAPGPEAGMVAERDRGLAGLGRAMSQDRDTPKARAAALRRECQPLPPPPLPPPPLPTPVELRSEAQRLRAMAGRWDGLLPQLPSGDEHRLLRILHRLVPVHLRSAAADLESLAGYYEEAPCPET